PSRLVESNVDALYRNVARGPIVGVFLALAAVAAFLGMHIAGRGSGRARAMLRWLGPSVMAFPAIELLSGVTPLHQLGAAAGTVVVTAASVAVGVLAALLARVHPRAPIVALGVLMYAVVAIDVLAGAPMQLDRVFGFSSVVAGRFVGLGNQAFAMMVAAAIVIATLGFRSVVAAVALFTFTVVIIGHPGLGSDVGGVLASIPAFAVIIVLMRGKKIKPLPIIGAGVAAAMALAVFAYIDLQRPPGERTHLARFVSSDRAEIITTVGRKAFAAVKSVARIEWSALLLAMLVVTALLRYRGNRPVLSARGAQTCLAGAITVGLLGWALNGSGVVVTAIVMVFVVPALLLLDVDTVRPSSGEEVLAPPS
ncbi:MAG TPA: hypothetical protein VM600_02900, partial [Actinomycetota bacterium]|nr:hypothetical protein [Actinomycetota bacterium]